jgi:signal transduction histidine kinase
LKGSSVPCPLRVAAGRAPETEVPVSHSEKQSAPSGFSLNQMLAYVADLELEVDRLRKQSEFFQEEVRGTLRQIRQLCGDQAKAEARASIAEIDRTAAGLAEVLRDLKQAPGYHPAHDQVVAIAVRPLIEQVFRTQQRMVGVPQAQLQLELSVDHVEWFPARLRHILENLISNSLRYRDPDKTEPWVKVALRAGPEGYEFRVSDNGRGLSHERLTQLLELSSRAAPARAAGLGVGLAVVKVLVEQSTGSLTVDSGEGQGTTFVALLPRYDMDDFLV